MIRKLIFISMILMSGCNSAREMEKRFQNYRISDDLILIKQDVFSERFSNPMVKDRIIINCKLNDIDGRFMLDTGGFDQTMVFKRSVSKFKLLQKSISHDSTVSKNVLRNTINYSKTSMQIGNFIINNVDVCSSEKFDIDDLDKLDVDGIIGVNVLTYFSLTIADNFVDFSLDSRETFPGILIRNKFFIFSYLGKQIIGQIDTGNPENCISKNLVSKENIESNQKTTRTDFNDFPYEVYGKAKIKDLKIESFNINEEEFLMDDDPRIQISLGIPILKNLIVKINYPKSRFSLVNKI